MFKQNRVSDDAMRLRLFPFSLRGRAHQWLGSLGHGAINTWEDMMKCFLNNYFPPSKTAKLWNAISSFTQMEYETLYDTWKRWKDLLGRCPHHQVPNWMQVQTFYNSLNYQTRQLVYAATGGALNKKTSEESLKLFEDMAKNSY